MSGALEAKIVHIDFETGKTGRIFATSPEIRGLMIGRRTREELDMAIPQAIVDMYAACGEFVVVTRMENTQQDQNEAWVAFPAEVARKALNASRTQSGDECC